MLKLHTTLFDRIAGPRRLSGREITVSTLAALAAVSVVTWLSIWALGQVGTPFLVASMGASAVLLFAVPSSPMNRPWSLCASHIVAAFIGISCARWIDTTALSLPLALGGALLAMQWLRCLHPPGGATALLMVLAPPEVQAYGYQLMLTPIAFNSLILLLCALGLKRFLELEHASATEQSPIHWHRPHTAHVSMPFTHDDLEAALAEMDTYVDVEETQLLELYQRAACHNRRQRLGAIRCHEVIRTEIPAAEFGTPLAEVWQWFQDFRMTGVAVVDRANRAIGVVTVQDFINHSATLPQDELQSRIHALITPTPGPESDKAEVAGQIMTMPAITAPQDGAVADVLQLLDEHAIHHIPITDERGKVVGILSREEIVSMLEHADR